MSKEGAFDDDADDSMFMLPRFGLLLYYIYTRIDMLILSSILHGLVF